MTLRSTQPLKEMSTRDTSWGKGGWDVGLTTLPPSCANCLEIWEPQPLGTLRASPGLKWDCFAFLLNIKQEQVIDMEVVISFLHIFAKLPCHLLSRAYIKKFQN